jgi:hypothetical protein
MITARLKNMVRYYWDKKDTVENCKSISISYLRKNSYLRNNQSAQIYWTNSITGKETGIIDMIISITEAEKFVRLNYKGGNINYDYKVSLTTTPCNFGGIRYWFICPLAINGVSCGRRVAKLYKTPDSNYFGCRHCHNLTYESKNESRMMRLGQLGYFFKANIQHKELCKSIKRWTWSGKPTRKAKKLSILKQQINRVTF